MYTFTAAVLMVLLHDADDDGDADGDDDGDDGWTHQIPQTMADEFDGYGSSPPSLSF